MEEKGTLEYHLRIKDLPLSERPRERLEHYGAGVLSTSELLAIILRTGMGGENVINLATRLLGQFGGLSGLSKADFAQISALRGMGQAKTAQVKAALELGRRLLTASPQERPQVKSPADVANLLLLEMAALEQEEMRVLFLDTKSRVLGISTIYMGSLHTAWLRIGELFREAVRRNCAAIVVVHNHPSGDPTPSPDDVKITQEIAKAGDLLGVEVLDHLVIGAQRYVSLREQGLGFG